jgi:hypothetical protein
VLDLYEHFCFCQPEQHMVCVWGGGGGHFLYIVLLLPGNDHVQTDNSGAAALLLYAIHCLALLLVQEQGDLLPLWSVVYRQ